MKVEYDLIVTFKIHGQDNFSKAATLDSVMNSAQREINLYQIFVKRGALDPKPVSAKIEIKNVRFPLNGDD